MVESCWLWQPSAYCYKSITHNQNNDNKALLKGDFKCLIQIMEEYPEICTQIVREDGVEIDLVACTVDVKKEEANACLYSDTSTDCWTHQHTWSKKDINIEE